MAGAVDLPAREGAVAAITGGISVCGSLDGPPVVAGGDRNGIDAVEDAFVVGGRTMGIDGRKTIGRHDAVPDLGALESIACQRFDVDNRSGPRQGAITQIRNDAQQNATARDGFEFCRYGFTHAIDQIGAHRITGVDQKMDKEGAVRRLIPAGNRCFDVPGTSATGNEPGVKAIRQVADLLPGCHHGLASGRRIDQVFDHDLADSHRIIA